MEQPKDGIDWIGIRAAAAAELARQEAEAEPAPGNAAEAALGSWLSRVLEDGGHRAGALLVTREPLPGVDATTRILSAVCMRELDVRTAVDLLQLAKRLRTLAVEIEVMIKGRGFA